MKRTNARKLLDGSLLLERYERNEVERWPSQNERWSSWNEWRDTDSELMSDEIQAMCRWGLELSWLLQSVRMML